MHTSVFLEEAIEALNIKQDGKYIDATYGEGGHAQKIKEKGGKVLGIDADPKQVQKHSESDVTVVQGNFAHIETLAKEHDFSPVDGILFDLGLSMEQLSGSERGFSYRRLEEPLDMRLFDAHIAAHELLRDMDQSELSEKLTKYSEDIHASDIANEIARSRQAISKVGDLTAIIDRVLERKHISTKKEMGHTYARIFQALRIMVNHELENISAGLTGALTILNTKGRIVVITFHSLEDRVVKLFAREHADTVDDTRIQVEKKRRLRSFERSARLRILEKK